MKKMSKITAVILAVAAFYLIGIVANTVIIEVLFNCDTSQTPIWSKNGAGHVFALIAGGAGILALKVYALTKNE